MKSKSNVRIVASGWQNFRRNSYLSIGTTGVMALTLLLFLGIITLNFFSTSVIDDLKNKVDITAYFKDDSSEKDILKVKDELQNLPEVKSVLYISQEEALEQFKERHKDDDLIQESLAELEENPLQASLNIKATDPSLYPSVVEFLEANAFTNIIDKINFYENRDVISRIEGITGGAERWGLTVAGILALIAILVAFNTIRLTIYSQRQEIEIMKLVGATNSQARGPYLMEGVFYGIFASVIALGIFYPAIYLVSPKLASLAPNIDLFAYFSDYTLQIVGMVVFVGVILGVISSSIAIRRYLKI